MRYKTWYSLGACWHFGQGHIRYVLENLNDIQKGRYPAKFSDNQLPTPGNPTRIQYSGLHDYTKVIDLAAELTRRIAKCGADGTILLMHYEDGLSEERIAYHLERFWHKPIGERGVRRAINRVIRYCTGEELRGCPFYHWKRAGRAGDCGDCHQLSACKYYHEPDL